MNFVFSEFFVLRSGSQGLAWRATAAAVASILEDATSTRVCRPACSFFSSKGACALPPTKPRICIIQMTRGFLIFSVGSILANQLSTTSKVCIAEPPLSSQSAPIAAVGLALRSITKYICSTRDRFVRIFRSPRKAAHLSAPRIPSFAGASVRKIYRGNQQSFGSKAPIIENFIRSKLIGTHLVPGIARVSRNR